MSTRLNISSVPLCLSDCLSSVSLCLLAAGKTRQPKTLLTSQAGSSAQPTSFHPSTHPPIISPFSIFPPSLTLGCSPPAGLTPSLVPFCSSSVLDALPASAAVSSSLAASRRAPSIADLASGPVDLARIGCSDWNISIEPLRPPPALPPSFYLEFLQPPISIFV